MSKGLGIIHWYVLEADMTTISASGTIQAAHVDSIKTKPGQTLRVGRKASALFNFEHKGQIMNYNHGQMLARMRPPGRGYIWRAGEGWLDNRPTAMAREDKISALHTAHEAKRAAPVTFSGMTFPVSQETMHRASFGAQMAATSLRPNDMRWRDVGGVVQTWATPAAYQAFLKGWGTAVAQQFADVDKWKDDLLDRINAAKINKEIDAITW